MGNEEHRAGRGGVSPAEATAAGLSRPPLFQVVAGHPTAEEVGALAAALTVKQAALARAAAARPAVSAWADRRRQLRLAPAPGPAAWRRSGLPG